MLLGDLAEKALCLVGITPARVAAVLGRECHCAERKAKLNALNLWARRVVSGKKDFSREYLERILGTLPEDCVGCDKEPEP